MGLFIGWLFDRRFTLWDCVCYGAFIYLLTERQWVAIGALAVAWIVCGITGEKRALKVKASRGLA